MEKCYNMQDRKGNSFKKLFERYKGQPVEILTDDGVRYCGIDLDADDESVEIIDKCSRIVYIPYAHIDAVIEPKMKLTRFCGVDDCDCCGKSEYVCNEVCD